jgi:RND superfamily putative drug exporter
MIAGMQSDRTHKEVPMPSAGPHSTSTLGRLGALAFRRRRLVLLAWVIALVGAFAASAQLAGTFSADYETPGSDSKAAADRLYERFPERPPYSVDVVWQARDAASPVVRRRVDGFLAAAQRLEAMGDGVSTRDAQVARDRSVAVVSIPFTVRSSDDVPMATSEQLIELAQSASTDGLRMELGGWAVANAEQNEVSSEAIGLLVAAIVLLLTFGSLVATGMPLATALFGLGISASLGGILAAVMDVPDWAPSVAAMIGLGVGIDYALLLVTRYRSALSRSLEPREAIVEAVSTAGRSVLIAGSTVVISMLGLFLVGLNYLYGVALSTIFAVVVVMAASVTLLPALLGFAGHRVNRLRIPGVRCRPSTSDDTPAARWAKAIQRRPWVAAIAGTAILLALAAPVTGLRLGFPDQGNNRPETTTRQAYDLLAAGFGPGSAGPLLLVADVSGAGDRAALPALAQRVGREEGVASVGKPVVNADGDTAVLSVMPTTSPQSGATEDLLRRLRGEVVPATGVDVQIGGITAAFVDQSEATAERLPVFIGGVVGLSFLLLLGAFRAPLIALKAGVLNLVSIAAAYGVVAMIAEGGFAGQLVGVDTATPVPPFIPVLMFAILFGLSMDYEVFLLSRVREEYLARRETSGAVAEGLARTARVITAAAAIMVAVFGAFVLSDEVFLKLIGTGLAAAILIDATVVRMVLVPAVMQLLGERNWWLPRWLDRVIPHVDVEPRSLPAS